MLNNFSPGGGGGAHFHSVLGLTNYVANPGREEKIEVGSGRGGGTPHNGKEGANGRKHWGWSQGTGSRGKHGQEPLFWFLQKGLGKVSLRV